MAAPAAIAIYHALKDHNYTGYPFKYLYDETQDVAKAYKAACTPEFYLADANLELFYHGQFDSSRPANNVKASGKSTPDSYKPLFWPQRCIF